VDPLTGELPFLEPVLEFFRSVSHTSLFLAIRYGLLAGIAWLLAYVLFYRRWKHRKVVQKLPDASEIRREMLYSACSVVIFAGIGVLTFVLAKDGWTQMYRRTNEYPALWFWLSIVCAIFIHDTWFYWTHRLMHHRKLFRFFHRTHHLSHNPSPWAAYAFDPAEAVVQALIFPLVLLVIPMHPAAFGLFMVWQITFNIIGHTGFEIYPKWLMDSWLGKFINTPTNHAMHHEKLRGNYGLYFKIWDRLMKTNHPDYEKRFREVTTRARE
jgi:sterol desaturase/sphingolipid hydroxylase (fatty acid hydroxylase superfamily)